MVVYKHFSLSTHVNIFQGQNFHKISESQTRQYLEYSDQLYQCYPKKT